MDLRPPPAATALDTAGVAYRIVETGRVRSAEEAAAARGIDLGQLVKTLVVRLGDGEHCYVLVPGDRPLDWAKLRSLLGRARMSLAPGDEAEAVTGFRPGTITPLGAKASLPVVLDAALLGHAEVSLGSGRAAVAVHLRPQDLVRVTGATVADVTRVLKTGDG